MEVVVVASDDASVVEVEAEAEAEVVSERRRCGATMKEAAAGEVDDEDDAWEVRVRSAEAAAAVVTLREEEEGLQEDEKEDVAFVTEVVRHFLHTGRASSAVR